MVLAYQERERDPAMNPFPVQLINDKWFVITGDQQVPCESKADAERLAQIPVQFALMRANALHQPPDRKVIESIIKLGDAYPFIRRMPEFQHMKTWFAKRAA